ncbi:MAG: hypothetical protein R3357_06035 [Burkholderiales bacterium]|nr:hypothetical protein [Burkholderiales bacterium]
MHDIIVRLRPVPVVAKLAGEMFGRDAIERYGVDAGAGTARLVVYVCAPERACEIRLWNLHGRRPKLLEKESVAGPSDPEIETFQCRMPDPIDKLDGLTVTWVARLRSETAGTFELRVDVYQGAYPLPEARFAYSGPLEAGAITERSGRFHFKYDAPQPSV